MRLPVIKEKGSFISYSHVIKGEYNYMITIPKHIAEKAGLTRKDCIKWELNKNNDLKMELIR